MEAKQEHFTLIQMLQFAAYEKVRSRGRYNMFDPAAMKSSGLDRDQYLFVMENFEALQAQSKEETS